MARAPLFAAALLAAAPTFVACTVPGVTHESATVELQSFDAISATQERYVWCWAACAQMALAYAGVETTQDEIVERIHGYDAEGELKVETATRYELYRALSPETEVSDFELLWDGIRDQLTQELEALGDELEDSLAGGDSVDAPSEVEVSFDESVLASMAVERMAPSRAVPIEALLSGSPAVAGLRDDPSASTGHLYMIVAADYLAPKEWSENVPDLGKSLAKSLEANYKAKQDSMIPAEASAARAESLAARFGQSKYQITHVELIDPFVEDDPDTPLNEMRVELEFDDFLDRVDFITTREDAHAILTEWTRLAKLEVE